MTCGLQESANSSFVQGLSGQTVTCSLNISALNLVSCIIESTDSMDGSQYSLFVSNDNHRWFHLRLHALQGTNTNNSWTAENYSPFASPLSWNFVRVVVPSLPDVAVSVVVSGRWVVL